MPLEGSFRNVGSNSDADEQQPLLSSPRKLPTINSSTETDPSLSPDVDLRVILPALMVCAFLAAFDVTVVAAIYPIMSAAVPILY